MVQRRKQFSVWKGWRFKLVCYGMALLIGLALFAPVTEVVAREGGHSTQSLPNRPNKGKSEARVLASEVAVRSEQGELSPELQNQVYSVIRTQPGRTTTQSQRQEDISAIYSTGYFSNVRALPEDTPLGVRVSFIVQPNPVLRNAQVQGNVGTNVRSVLPPKVVDQNFRSQYGSILNLNRLSEGIKGITKWYQDNGYVLAQIVGAPQVSPDGTVTLEVAEGVIEDIQVRFRTKEGEETDAKGRPIRGRTKKYIITRELELRPGQVFNSNTLKRDLNRVYRLGLFEHMQATSNPGQDPRKVVVAIYVSEYTLLEQAAKAALDLQDLKNNLGALDQFQTVLQIARDTHSEADEVLTLNNIANLYKDSEDYQQAKENYYQALAGFQKLNARFLEGITYINLGHIHGQLKKYDQAIDCYQKALQIVHLVNKDFRETDSLGLHKKDDVLLLTNLWEPALALDIATTYAFVGDYQQALYTLNSVYPILEHSLSNLNNKLFEFLGKKVYEEYKSEINQTLSQVPEIVALLPFVYSSMGDAVTAKSYTEQAKNKIVALLSVWKKSANEGAHEFSRYIQVTVDIVSLLLGGQSDSQQMTMQVQKMGELLTPLISTVSDESLKPFIPYIRVLVPSFLNWISTSGDDKESLLLFSQALKLLDFFQNDLAKQTDWLKPSYFWIKSIICNLQGTAYFRLGRYREALEVYRQALELSNSNQNQFAPAKTSENPPTLDSGSSKSFNLTDLVQLFSSTQRASSLLAIGKVYDALGDRENARASYRQFLQLPDSSRSSLGDAEAHYGVAKAELFLGNALEAQAQINEAIAKSEQPPATLTNKGYGSGFSNAELKYGYGLKNDEGGNRGVLEGGFVLSRSALEFTSGTDKPDPTAPCNTLSDYFACKQKYFEFYISLLLQRQRQQFDEVRAFEASERARAVTAQAFRTSRTDQANQKSENQLAGTTNSNGGKRGRTRPASLSEIQSLLDENTLLLEYFLGEKESYLWAVSRNSLKTYFLPGRSTIEIEARKFYDLLTTPSGRIRPKTTANVGKELSEMVLGPVAEQLGQKRLLIVGDGILQYIPFGVLPDLAAKPNLIRNSSKGEFAPYMQPLLVNREVVNLLSASAMVELRQNQSHRPTPTMELAVFADPVLNFEDRRIDRAVTPEAAASQNHTTLPNKVEQVYASLPETKREVEQLLPFVTPNQRSQFLGFDANYETATSNKLSQYRRIHFATHGFFNTKSPEQSGIVLSAIRRNGDLQRGAITPATTLDMNLAAADLVVLSGCRTGLSGEMIREGLTGLTGGLMSAGAERVVVSLWSVNDEATEKLMALFYQNMYKNHASPAQALRSAQLSMWQDERWQTPYNWAAFAIYGEWK